MRNTPEGRNCRLGDTQELISDLENRIMDITQSEQQTERKIKKKRKQCKKTFILFCFCSVTKLCPTLSYPIDCSTPGFPVLHYLQEFA